ncbi:MAG: class I SAM-dependent methyltransferase [Ruminococcus sp.]|nr:class I SAM-dependent methyltransferase [Ruminococcus sp.]
MIDEIKEHWNGISDSQWYRSLRSSEKIDALFAEPERAFHPEVMRLIRTHTPVLKDMRVLLPSSRDNHAAFAFALMGAVVTSADISERQLENAEKIAKERGLDIRFVCDDTMTLSNIGDDTYDLVYTSNGTLSWINDLESMYRNFARVLKKGGMLIQYDIHPFTRPFSCEAYKAPQIVKSYHDVLPHLHWRIQDLLNEQVRAGFMVTELAELPAVDASFWYTYQELQTKTEQELKNINDPKENPMAALPAWIAFVSKKQ